MKKSAHFIAGLVLMACLLPMTAHSSTQDASNETDQESSRFSLGFQSTYPAWGLSGMMDINETISAQAILGFLGVVNTFAGRGLYRFRQEDYWDLYGYGMVGMWRYNTRFIEAENRLGLGAGAGIQYDWRVLDPNLPPIFWNLEIGFGYVNFNHYNFNMISFGAGVHYRF